LLEKIEEIWHIGNVDLYSFVLGEVDPISPRDLEISIQLDKFQCNLSCLKTVQEIILNIVEFLIPEELRPHFRLRKQITELSRSKNIFA